MRVGIFPDDIGRFLANFSLMWSSGSKMSIWFIFEASSGAVTQNQGFPLRPHWEFFLSLILWNPVHHYTVSVADTLHALLWFDCSGTLDPDIWLVCLWTLSACFLRAIGISNFLWHFKQTAVYIFVNLYMKLHSVFCVSTKNREQRVQLKLEFCIFPFII